MNEINVNGPAPDWTDKEWNTFQKWLKGILKVGPATVTFIKKDGTERIMKCTLEPTQLPPAPINENKKERKVSNDTLVVFDLEAQGWRSFTVKSIKRVELTIG